MGALDRAQRALSNAPLLAKGNSPQQNLEPAKEREARSSTGAALQVLFRPPPPRDVFPGAGGGGRARRRQAEQGGVAVRGRLHRLRPPL